MEPEHACVTHQPCPECGVPMAQAGFHVPGFCDHCGYEGPPAPCVTWDQVEVPA